MVDANTVQIQAFYCPLHTLILKKANHWLDVYQN